MTARLLIPALLFALAPLQAQESPRERFLQARDAWEEGRFPDALASLEELLLSSEGEALLREIALLTGELHPVRELTPDGRAVRWSPDGRHGAYESGSGLDVVTHVLEVMGGDVREAATFPGSGLVFAPAGGEVAWLAVRDREALEEAQARLQAGVDPGDRAARTRIRGEMERLQAQHTRIMVQALGARGEPRALSPAGLSVRSLLYSPDGSLHALAAAEGEEGTNVFRLGEGGVPTAVTRGGATKTDPFFAAGGAFLVYGTGRGAFAVLEVASGSTLELQGSPPVVSGDGRTLAFVGEEDGAGTLNVLDLASSDPRPRVVARTADALSASVSRSCPACPGMAGLSLSPDGGRLAYQAMPREDWELFVVPTDGGPAAADPFQLTREIQHDLYPVFLADGRLLGMKGEGRHRRSHLYDLESGEITWLFRNNTVRTVAPEYEWAPSPDGTKLLIGAERDGNTVSPERGVYLMDLGARVTREDVLARVREQLAAERDLRTRVQAMYAPVEEEIRAVVERVSVPRIFRDEEALFRMGSKNVSQPGNRPAIDYLEARLREMGYEPELQWFDARGVQSANVVARLEGTVSPEVVYAVSAHFDSNTRSFGADDNNTGTVGLLEMARVLAGRPLPATVEIALFTGEESGLLGSREYVRRAVESGKLLVGALNNDMVGFAEDHRLDNTIRYSNKGIRDVQHGAALLFSRMTLHDAEYYKSTDAAAYYDAYGDIVGGIGSYPILANPHYHQTHDHLETVNHQLVAEVAKVTTASTMLLASAPSRLRGVEATRQGGGITVRWEPAVERDVVEYLVAWGPPEEPLRNTQRVREPNLFITGFPPGHTLSVKSVNRRGMEGWDWARAEVGG